MSSLSIRTASPPWRALVPAIAAMTARATIAAPATVPLLAGDDQSLSLRMSFSSRRLCDGVCFDLMRSSFEVPLGVDGRHAARARGGNRLPVDMILNIA